MSYHPKQVPPDNRAKEIINQQQQARVYPKPCLNPFEQVPLRASGIFHPQKPKPYIQTGCSG